MKNALGVEINGTRFTFEHSFVWRDSARSRIYRSTRWWKTPKGALRAAEAFAKGLEFHFDVAKLNYHALVIKSDLGEFVTNEAA